METFLQNFKLELLGTVTLSSYLAWIIWSVVGQILATLIRNHLTSLKSYPVNLVQIITGLLIVLAFIRFGFEITTYFYTAGFVPTAFGAFLLGLGGNELALPFLKKYLNKNKEYQDNFVADAPIDGGGDPNDPKKKP